MAEADVPTAGHWFPARVCLRERRFCNQSDELLTLERAFVFQHFSAGREINATAGQDGLLKDCATIEDPYQVPPDLLTWPPGFLPDPGPDILMERSGALLSDPPALQPSDPPALQPSNPSALQPSNPPTLQRSNPPTLRPSNPPTLQRSDPPTLRPSDPPALQPSDPSALQPSDPPALQTSNPPTLRPSNPPTLQPSSPPAKWQLEV
ncbi:uncharacterized protein LOC130128386 [Lampris incognitus]|uniref:uncharacterized protein LOC130128386 n=1 Tax=Lampris incognitus TaxID=2546036 RepID=UPI0024B5EBED|nr:uncharacterized protein LOC130128386 [Lampris incognitus]